MYNYPPQGQYGPPPGFGGFPAPGAPPGMSAPGVGSAPGMQQAQSPAPGGFPPNFQPPAGMSNINFSAPVIRLGTSSSSADTGPSKRGTGLGFDARNSERERQREVPVTLAPPTREEIARTIFVGNITEGCGGDDGLQRILSSAGGLRRWTRAVDANGKPCTFGFAEFEDAESLGTACELFKDVEVPTKRPTSKTPQNGEEPAVETSKLLVVVDENSLKYVEEWRDRGSMKDPAAAQFRLDSARDDLAQALASLSRVGATFQEDPSTADGDGDASMADGDPKTDMGEVITIALSGEDELSDIPAEMRETVAKEIQAFRDRSNRRDIERLKREEELEHSTRQRHSRLNRPASPSLAAPAGPGGTNGIPVGPRVQGAPAGPKGFAGSQMPRDYQKNVAFVNGTGLNGASISINREDEDSDASDEELERRRQEKKALELEKLYLDQERRWLNREKSRTAAVDRETQRDKDAGAAAAAEKAAVAKRLGDWDDDAEAARGVEEYYRDRSQWLRSRALFRAREADADAADRAAEEREKSRDQDRRSRELGLADRFLDAQATELAANAAAAPARGAQPFKMSLGAAAQKVQAASAARRTIAEVEGLLEDEEDAEAAGAKRTLVPIEFDAAAGGGAAALSEEERQQAIRKLAAEIPTDKDGLWGWKVKWESLDDAVVGEQLRPFVEKKIVEYLGVQEQMLVDVVETCVRQKGSPGELVGELEGALDEEAEVLVKKLWRMIIFFTESESRGLAN